MYSSKALTPNEQWYAQIEKECLAIVFAFEKLHQYLFGRDLVTVQSDHRLLETIFKKSLQAVPALLQRMLLHFQKYSMDVHMYIADTLSRSNLQIAMVNLNLFLPWEMFPIKIL